MASGEIVRRFLARKEANLRSVNPKELEAMYSSMFPEGDEKVVLVTGGEGRSGEGIRIGMRYTATIPGFFVFGPDDTYMPGSRITKAFEKLKKEGYSKFTYIVASDSGETSGPIIDMKCISEYNKSKRVQVTESDKSEPLVNLCLITSSYAKSTMSNIVKENKEGGTILILPGRMPGTKDLPNRGYLSEGNQGDLIETETAELANLFTLGFREKINPHDFVNFFKEELEQMPKRHEEILKLRNSSEYAEFLRLIENPEIDFFSCGQNVSLDVAKFNNIRLMHTRSYVADFKRSRGEYRGEFPNNTVHRESAALPIKKNSVVLVISKSYDRKAPEFVKNASEKNAHCLTITKRKNNKKPEYGKVFHIDGGRFYPDVCTLLTCANLDALENTLEKMEEEGCVPKYLEITERKMKSYHASDKRSQI